MSEFHFTTNKTSIFAKKLTTKCTLLTIYICVPFPVYLETTVWFVLFQHCLGWVFSTLPEAYFLIVTIVATGGNLKISGLKSPIFNGLPNSD